MIWNSIMQSTLTDSIFPVLMPRYLIFPHRPQWAQTRHFIYSTQRVLGTWQIKTLVLFYEINWHIWKHFYRLFLLFNHWIFNLSVQASMGSKCRFIASKNSVSKLMNQNTGFILWYNITHQKTFSHIVFSSFYCWTFKFSFRF